MIRISKSEKEYLLSKGYGWGEFLHKTHSNAKSTYYATEARNLLNDLNRYRKSRIIKTVGNKNKR